LGVAKFRQKIASFLSAALFGGFLWILFKKINIVVLVHMKWWHFVLLLAVLFLVIDTMVSKGLGAKKPLERGKDKLDALHEDVSEKVSERSEAVLNEIKRKLAE
jgi:hypothetical protein